MKKSVMRPVNISFPKLLAGSIGHGKATVMLRSALFILLLAPRVHSVEPLFSDSFANGLAQGWSWIREDKSAWRATARGLEIRIQPGNQWGPENSGKNVLVRDLPDTNRPIEISVTVEHRPTEQYEQVDLVAYFDDSHMVKIGEELVDGKLSIVMGREEKDRARTLAIIPLAQSRVELKLKLDGPDITGFFRPDGAAEWTKAGQCDLPRASRPRITIQCYQGSSEKEHWAKIQNFRISHVHPAE